MKRQVPSYNYEALTAYREGLEAIGFEWVGGGDFRSVYGRRGVVVKIPSDTLGLRHNIIEAYAYHKFRRSATPCGVVFAPCKLLPNGCLMMVLVRWPDYGHQKMPTWANYIDHDQVSMYNGRWVAYDASVDVGHDFEIEASEWVGIDGEPFILEEYLEAMSGVHFGNVMSQDPYEPGGDEEYDE